MTPEFDERDVSDTDTSFIERWSRRKREQRPAKPDVANPDDTSSRPPAELADTATADPDVPLPSLDDMTETSDLTAFLEKRVPEELRRLAMRKMWALDPQIRDFIEMAENQYDWNTPGGAPGFGDLDPGTDIQALLAQAVGLAPAKAAIEPQATVAALSPSEQRSDEQTAVEQPVASVASDESKSDLGHHESANSVRRTDGPTGPNTPSNGLSSRSQSREDNPNFGCDAESDLDDQHTNQPTRRHGRALPA